MQNESFNFQLTKGSWYLNNENILFYLLIYKDNRTIKINKKRDILITDFIYKDGLHIQIKWKIFDLDITFQPDIDDLINFYHKGKVDCLDTKFISYHKKYKNYQQNTYKKFLLLLGLNPLKTYNINQKEYYELEHKVLKKTNFCEEFFNNLLEQVEKYKQFEHFLNNRKDI